MEKLNLDDMKNQIKLLLRVLFISLLLLGCDSNKSASESESKISSAPDIYGSYSDFSGWFSGIDGSFNITQSSWSGFINDNGDIINYKGITKGNDLLDQYGSNKVGYISGNKVYIYYLNSYYPVGR